MMFVLPSSVKIFNIKPIKFNKLNSKEIGYMWKDKKISFLSDKAVEKYAKNRVVSALQGTKPFERGVVYKDNYVIKEVNGDRFSTSLKGEYSLEGTTIAHGHPRIDPPYDSPLSFSDFVAFNMNGVKKMIAYNKDGEYSSFTTLPQNDFIKKLLPDDFQKAGLLFKKMIDTSRLLSKYSEESSKLYPKKFQKFIEAFTHQDIGKPYASKSQMSYLDNVKLAKDDLLKLYNLNTKFLADGSLFKLTHNFWKNNAQKYGYRYETNFSYLKNQS